MRSCLGHHRIGNLFYQSFQITSNLMGNPTRPYINAWIIWHNSFHPSFVPTTFAHTSIYLQFKQRIYQIYFRLKEEAELCISADKHFSGQLISEIERSSRYLSSSWVNSSSWAIEINVQFEVKDSGELKVIYTYSTNQNLNDRGKGPNSFIIICLSTSNWFKTQRIDGEKTTIDYSLNCHSEIQKYIIPQSFQTSPYRVINIIESECDFGFFFVSNISAVIHTCVALKYHTDIDSHRVRQNWMDNFLLYSWRIQRDPKKSRCPFLSEFRLYILRSWI